MFYYCFECGRNYFVSQSSYNIIVKQEPGPVATCEYTRRPPRMCCVGSIYDLNSNCTCWYVTSKCALMWFSPSHTCQVQKGCGVLSPYKKAKLSSNHIGAYSHSQWNYCLTLSCVYLAEKKKLCLKLLIKESYLVIEKFNMWTAYINSMTYIMHKWWAQKNRASNLQIKAKSIQNTGFQFQNISSSSKKNRKKST